MTVDDAAATLLAQIDAPRGAVNTLGFSGASGAVIRVLVDPGYWHFIGTIPTTFEGYQVMVEKRVLSVAFH
jgi:hypothetical protein